MLKSKLARDLTESAQTLLDANSKMPRQADLRRVVSTAYYALFHCLCNNCADCFIGQENDYPKNAWRRVYRSVNHGGTKDACNKKSSSQKSILEKFPDEIQDFANQLYNMQIERHQADYDPYYEITMSSAKLHLSVVRSAIVGFENSPLIDRKAFASLVLFKDRKS